MSTITFNTLKKSFLDSGFEIRRMPRIRLEELALDEPFEAKRHTDSNIMGLLITDENSIGIASELDDDEAALTLLHEMIHLYDEEMDEDTVEELTLEFENNLTQDQFGFLKFLVA